MNLLGLTALDGSIDVVEIFSMGSALLWFERKFGYAALREDGSVITWNDNWGNSITGADVRNDINGNIDVTDIIGSYGAFAALREDGSVITWETLNMVETAQLFLLS